MLRLQQATLLRDGRRIVDGLDLTVHPGRLLVLLGPNGAGKSSALGMLSGRLNPDQGEALLDERPLSQWPPGALARRRAVLSQRLHLGFGFTATQVVLLGRAPQGGGDGTAADRRIVSWALHAVGARHLAARSYLSLSGGEQQRVQLARVLAQVRGTTEPPAYLLLDEPEAGLDVAHQHQLLLLARSLAAEGYGLCVVLHDLNLAARHADEVALMEAGRLVALGEPETALEPSLLSRVYKLAMRSEDVGGRRMIIPA